jgi:hypothetical protein
MTALSRWRSRESLHGRDADVFDGTRPEGRTGPASEQDAGDGGREIAGEQTADHRAHAEPGHVVATPSVWSVFVFILLLIVTRFLEFAGQLFSNSRRKNFAEPGPIERLVANTPPVRGEGRAFVKPTRSGQVGGGLELVFVQCR